MFLLNLYGGIIWVRWSMKMRKSLLFVVLWHKSSWKLAKQIVDMFYKIFATEQIKTGSCTKGIYIHLFTYIQQNIVRIKDVEVFPHIFFCFFYIFYFLDIVLITLFLWVKMERFFLVRNSPFWPVKILKRKQNHLKRSWALEIGSLMICNYWTKQFLILYNWPLFWTRKYLLQ